MKTNSLRGETVAAISFGIYFCFEFYFLPIKKTLKNLQKTLRYRLDQALDESRDLKKEHEKALLEIKDLKSHKAENLIPRNNVGIQSDIYEEMLCSVNFLRFFYFLAFFISMALNFINQLII